MAPSCKLVYHCLTLFLVVCKKPKNWTYIPTALENLRFSLFYFEKFPPLAWHTIPYHSRTWVVHVTGNTSDCICNKLFIIKKLSLAPLPTNEPTSLLSWLNLYVLFSQTQSILLIRQVICLPYHTSLIKFICSLIVLCLHQCYRNFKHPQWMLLHLWHNWSIKLSRMVERGILISWLPTHSWNLK